MTSKVSVIVVLGMHRSGTSAVARSLQVMGVDLGDKLQAQDSANAKGYWEDRDIIDLNVRMLRSLGMDWHTLAPVREHHVNQLEEQGYLQEALELLRQKLKDRPLFGFKDPRVTKLLPAWRKVFVYGGLDVRYVLAVRHPESVVRSLMRRDGFSPEKCNLLWLGHVLESLGPCGEGLLSLIVDYDRLIAAPEGELRRMSGALGLPLDETQLRAYVEVFIDGAMRHAINDAGDLEAGPTRPPLVKDVYATLLSIAADEVADHAAVLVERLAGWRSAFAQVLPALIVADDLWAQHGSKVLEVRALVADLAALRKELDDKSLQVENLSQAVSEYVMSIQELQKAGLARDRQVVGLGQAIAEREHRVKELVEHVDHLQAALAGTAPVLQQHVAEAAQLAQASREMRNHIEELTRELEKRDGHLISFERTLSTLRDDVVVLNDRLLEKDRTIAELNVKSRALDLQVQALQSQLLSANSESVAIRRDLASREEQLVVLRRDSAQQAADASARLADLEAKVEDSTLLAQSRLAQVTALSQRLHDREATVGNLSRAVSEYAGVMASMNQHRVVQDKEIQRLRTDLAMRSKELEDQDLVHRALLAELRQLQGSPWVRMGALLHRRVAVDQGVQGGRGKVGLPHRSAEAGHAHSAATAAPNIDALLQVQGSRFIEVLYRTLLRRPPDAEGLLHYHRLLARGVARLQLVADVAMSPEAGRQTQQRLPGLDDVLYLRRIARIPLLGSKLLPPDFFEPSSHPRAVSALPLDIDGLIGLADDEVFLTAAYRHLLRRSPDASGIDFYLRRLHGGGSRIRVLGELVASREAAAIGGNPLLWRAQILRRRMLEAPLIARWLPDTGSPSVVPLVVPVAAADSGGTGLNGESRAREQPTDVRSWWSIAAKPRTTSESQGPLLSIVMPVYRTPLDLLRVTIASVLAQEHTHWELCICNDGSGIAELDTFLRELCIVDSRVKYVALSRNVGISGASNEALGLASGEYIALLDHDDELTVDALAAVVAVLTTDSRIDAVYTDQDKTDSRGLVVDTFFKPDWSPDYFRRVMYVGHLLVVRTSLARRVGGFDSRFDRVQDYEFMLRISEHATKIVHVPRVLYHWRAIEGSIAATADAKGGIEALQCLAVQEHLARVGLKGKVERHGFYAHRTVVWPVEDRSGIKVSIIIPSKDHPEHIGRCLASIFGKSTHRNLEVIVVDNGTTNPEAVDIMQRFPVTVVPFHERFNYSRANNLGAARATGDVLVLLNNDTEVVTDNWIELLLDALLQSDVGIVGPMLLYPNGSVQHAGIVLGPRGTADHVMRGFPGESDGYAGSLSCVREVSGITGACLVVRRSDYGSIGGLSELYATHYQDVDFCLAVRRRGHRILHVPQAKLIHHESASRGSDYDMLDRLLLQDTWRSEIRTGDPYFNRAFSLERLDYSLALDGGVST